MIALKRQLRRHKLRRNEQLIMFYSFISLFHILICVPPFLFCFFVFCMSRKFIVNQFTCASKIVLSLSEEFFVTEEQISKRLDRRSPCAPIHSGANPLTGKSELKPLAVFPG